jgi:hypothetical protein
MNKKYIRALVIGVIFSNCEISPRKVKAEDFPYCQISSKDYFIEGMHYRIHIYTKYDASSHTIINITKDSLECEYYRKQLKTSEHE